MNLRLLLFGIAILWTAGCSHSGTRPSDFSVTITPQTAQVDVGASQQFTATVVSATTDHTVVWTLSGQCSDAPRCGTIDESGKYTAPPTLPNPSAVLVRATLVGSPNQTATAIVTLIDPVADRNAGKLAGHYRVEFNGTYSDSTPVSVIGTLSADGHGKLTGGDINVTWVGTVYSRTIADSSYSIGDDNRGLVWMNFQIGSPGPDLWFTFAIALDSFSSAGIANSGTLTDAAEPPSARATGTGTLVRTGS